ncbi:putative phage abortive infection protein [Zobellia roscoffensis]
MKNHTKGNNEDKKEEAYINSTAKMSLLYIGLAIFGFLILLIPFFSNHIKYKDLASMGDAVGGILNPLVGIAAALLTFLAFYIQFQANKQVQKQFEIQKFESQFYEMIKLYRDNVSEMRYEKYHEGKDFIFENRQALRVLFKEFTDCYRDVKKFSRSQLTEDYINTDYIKELNSTVKKTNSNIDLIEMSIIDISYCIFFYGLGESGIQILRAIFKKKYNSNYYFKLLFYMQLKPKQHNIKRYNLWKDLRGKSLEDFQQIIDELYNNRQTPEAKSELSPFSQLFKMHLGYEKFYGGHQFRLGHYFRHLFLSYNFLERTNILSKVEKYNYGKIYRAQLSNYEQALIFINSISSMGVKWELNPKKNNENYMSNLITTYGIIRNLPSQQLYDIRYDTYYPNVRYESDEYMF